MKWYFLQSFILVVKKTAMVFSIKKCGVTNLAYLCQTAFKSFELPMWRHIYTDFRKVFELRFSQKLLNSFKSYWFNRYNFVEIEGFWSHPFCPFSGVPQSSNLDPLLFVFFINNLSQKLTSHKIFNADDLNLYYIIRSEDDVYKYRKM